jgi:formate hydrogenlyase subunit 6/NADH:ubiquinone oxidoreductase subunit I
MRLREVLAKRYRGITAWIKLITFYEIAVGMKSTMSHLIHYKPITLQYPHEKRMLPDNYRGMLALLRYDLAVFNVAFPGQPAKDDHPLAYVQLPCIESAPPAGTPPQ